MALADADIFKWNQRRSEDMARLKTKERLGLRGHLQDELLRIQVMLSQDDSMLNVSSHIKFIILIVPNVYILFLFFIKALLV